MKGTSKSSWRARALRTLPIVAVGVVSLGAMLFGQKNSVQPQPQADKLAQITPPTRGAGGRGAPPAPEGVIPNVPAGFTIIKYADMPSPRTMVSAPNGDVFVASTVTSTIRALRDANNDGTFEAQGVYAQAAAPAGRGGGGGFGRGRGQGAAAPPQPDLAELATKVNAAPGVNLAINGPIYGAAAPACTPAPAFQPGPGGPPNQPFGMAFQGGYFYVANTGNVVRYKYANGDMQAQGEPEKIADLPAGGSHFTRNLIFNRAGTKFYVAVGSNSNNNAGEDCRRAAILEFNPDGSGMRIFASGIRNPVGLALQPGTDIVWTAINERDQLGDDLVPDYATSVKEGGFYGWPYSYIGKNPDPRYVGAFPELVNRAIVPDVLIPAHSAALGITFYTGTQFPQRYRNGGFVALHGSWNRSVAAGYRVIFFPMNNGRPGPIEDFTSGFLASDGTAGSAISAWGRPVGVTVAPDGGLLISDDAGNKIWKVSAAATGARRGE